MGFVACAFQQCKNFENRLRFDKVTDSLKMATFLRHSVVLGPQVLGEGTGTQAILYLSSAKNFIGHTKISKNYRWNSTAVIDDYASAYCDLDL